MGADSQSTDSDDKMDSDDSSSDTESDGGASSSDSDNNDLFARCQREDDVENHDDDDDPYLKLAAHAPHDDNEHFGDFEALIGNAEAADGDECDADNDM